MALKTICSLFILIGALFPLNGHGMEMTLSEDDVGQLWLQLMGRIEDNDDVKFKKMLVAAINRGDQVTNVSVYSPGGQVIPAIKIGRYIRTMHLTTVAPQLVPLVGQHMCNIHTVSGRTIIYYDPGRNRGDPRCACAGECFLIWAAGTIRVGAAVQVHRVTLQGYDDATSAGAPPDVDASGQAVVEEYLREMGIQDVTIERMFSISPEKREHLNKDERDMLTGKDGLPWLKEMLSARCRHHAAGSPAAFGCKTDVIRELYWTGAKQMLSEKE